ncbi:DUF2911 domain-containing protein [Mesonia ostreae]|uniref:DUF2911 domain-containing protein n=1 Tax=Mesonia ostreae TaxID=861110 RepID=A0ABU2KJU3_9FLAO|nr:DUF2911 domain-containing protein [Mesonia ostreae]MDT0294973.1 DUF2911 domain-containing protein [Mesonia ostreae]
MRKFTFLLVCILFAGVSSAQIQTPQPSPSAKMEQMVGLTNIELEYSRPSMRGREVFGNLVPYDKMWRTGANTNTTISFSDDVKIGGEKLPAGTYAIFTVPHKNNWDVIFYSDSNNWGLPEKWNESKVALKASAESQKMPMEMETFTMVIDDLTNNSAVISFLWGDTAASFTVDVPTKDKTMANIEKALNGPTASDYYASAVYYYEEGKDIKQALEWINKSVDMQKNTPYYMLRKKSLIEAKAGKKKEAIATAKESLAGAKKAGNKDYVKMNEDSLKEWGAK